MYLQRSDTIIRLT